jgi:abortive infection bacteriophage resistance protein
MHHDQPVAVWPGLIFFSPGGVVVEYSKPWLTLDQQVERLRGRGLVVESHPAAVDLLDRVGYYRLTGYLYPLRQPDVVGDGHEVPQHITLRETYRTGASIEHARSLMDHDRALRLLVLDGVERIEVAVRTKIAHVLGRNGPFAHRDPASFTPSFLQVGEAGTSGHERWIERVRARQDRSDEVFVAHFRTRYDGQLPVWALTEILEFGQVARLYGGLSNVLGTEIAMALGAPSKRVLGSWLASINYVRNVAAHHARLFNRKLVVAPKRPANVPEFDHLRRTEHAKVVFGVYGVLVVMAFLLRRIDADCAWRQRATALLHDFPDVPGMSTADLGAPVGWAREPIWRPAEGS